MIGDIQTVILCGGKGARISPEELPKPMFHIGEKADPMAHYGDIRLLWVQ